MPLWLAVLVLVPGYVHHERRVVAQVGRTGARRVAAYAARLALPVIALVALPFVAVLGPLELTIVIVQVVAFMWLLVVIGLAVVGGWQLTRKGKKPAGNPTTWKADRARVREAQWSVTSVASRENAGGMGMVREHLHAVAAPGELILLQAASIKHARVYERMGCVPLRSRPLRLIYQVP